MPIQSQNNYAPQVEVFESDGEATAIQKANAFSIKQRHLRPASPMPLIQPKGDGSVHVVYFIDVNPPGDLEVKSTFTGRQPDTGSGWWPQRLK